MGFSAKRRADFAAGRACARRALRELGYERFALERASDRRPRWPDGVIGSISHTAGFCGAVVAPSARFRSIGFDAENLGGVSEELWPSLFTGAERERLAALLPARRSAAATLLFSAKEAYYKCNFGLAAEWLDFGDVAVTLAGPLAEAGAFHVVPEAGRSTSAAPRAGRYVLEATFVLTGIADPCRAKD